MHCTALCVSYIWQRHVLVYLSSTADKHKHNSFFPKSVFAKTSALSCQVTLLSAQTKTEPFTFQSSIAKQKHVDWIKHSLVFNLNLIYYPLLSAWKRLHLFWYIDLRYHRLHSVVHSSNILQKMFSDLKKNQVWGVRCSIFWCQQALFFLNFRNHVCLCRYVFNNEYMVWLFVA